MIGIELAPGVGADALIKALLSHGVLTKDAHCTIRITPPLIITKDECDELAKRVLRAFRTAACMERACTCGKRT